MSDHTPTPFILDVGVLTDIARGDGELIGLMQDYDRIGQPLVIPALAAAGALLDAEGDEAYALLTGLSAFDHTQIAPMDSIEQAALIAQMISKTGLGPWQAHVATLADMATCPILTLDPAQWSEPSRALDDPLHIIEISDPDR